MGAIVVAVWLSLASAALMCAADEPPPLDQIKDDLKAAKSGGASELTAPAAAPALLIPGFVPSAARESPSVPPPTSDSARKKREADPNWLLHAMEAKPKPRDGHQRRANETDAQPGETGAHAATDPDSMLSIYREQEMKDREQQKRPEHEPDLTLSKPGDVGLFSDLLRQWMTPQDQALFGLKPGAQSADGALPAQAAPSLLPPADATIAPPRGPNPFLDGIQTDLRTPDAHVPVSEPSGALAVAPPETRSPGPLPVVTPVVPGKDDSQLRPAHQADDKKFFPQLDRF